MLNKLLKIYREKGKMIILIISLMNLSTGIICIVISYVTNTPMLMITGILNLLVSIQVALSYYLVIRIKALRRLLELVLKD